MSGPRALAPRMIGRQEQLRELDEHLRVASSGAGRVVLVAGEAGVGKTRLVRTFLEQARGMPAIGVLEGYCYEEDMNVPYAPLVGVLRGFVREHGAGALTAAAGPWAPDLLRLLPELDAGTRPRSGDDPREQKRRLLEAVYHLLRPPAEEQCRIVVLEDLHWADESCHEVIRFLARMGEHDRILLLGTYRSETLDRRNPLTYLVAQLARERRVHEVRLTPLSRDELARMLETTLERALPASVVDMLHDHTAGNPFFVEEALKALIERGRLDTLLQEGQQGKMSGHLAVPFSLKESILSRAADLDATTVAVLTDAAVIGRRFDFDLLQRLTGLREEALMRAIETLIARQLVIEEADGAEDRYAFRHALTREAIYGDLLGRERRRRHRAILEALEEMHAAAPDAVIDQLAYHSLHARAFEKAARYARLAGARATLVFAYQEAVAHYEVALNLLGTDDVRARAELLDTMGEAAFPIGDTSICLRYWQEAQRCYEQIGDREKVAAIHRRLGRIAWERGESENAFAHTRAAVDILDTEPPGHERAMAYSALSQLLMLTTQSYESIVWGEKALRMADEIGDISVTAHALNNIGVSLMELGEWRRGMAHLERSLAIAKAHDLSFDVFRASNNLTDLLDHVGLFGRATEVAREGIALADALGWHGKQSMIAHNLANAEMSLGAWSLAHEILDHAMLTGAMGYPAARLFAIPHKAELLLRQGQPAQARALLEETLPAFERQGMFQSLNRVCDTLARTHVALGDTERGLMMMDWGIVLWREIGPQVRATLILFHGIEVYLATGRSDRAPELLDGLATIADRAATPLALACFANARGLVAADDGRHEEAIAHFQEAIERWQAMGCPYEETRARQWWAASRLRSGDPDARKLVAPALFAAREMFVRLGAPLDLEAVDAVMKRHGLTTRANRAAASGAGALTPREREVLALIVQGRSNRAIAEELFISAKTTEIHVGNILSKLGCTSRTQAAALAVARRLIVAPDD